VRHEENIWGPWREGGAGKAGGGHRIGSKQQAGTEHSATGECDECDMEWLDASVHRNAGRIHQGNR
jgi:hypothetical protein